MSDPETLMVRAVGLPAAELERLLRLHGSEFPGLVVSAERGGGERGVLSDPQVVIALVSALSTSVATPFVSALVTRLFSAEPKAAITIKRADGGEVTLQAAVTKEQRDAMIQSALAGTASRELTIVMP